MILSNKLLKNIALLFSAAIFLSGCNKDVEQFDDIYEPPVASNLAGLADTLASAARANNSLYNAIIVKAGMADLLNDKSKTYTMFVPTNAAVKQAISAMSGGLLPIGAPDANFLAFIQNNLPAEDAKAIVSYNTAPQVIDFATLPSTFPNFQYTSLFNPAPQLSPLARLTFFPSRANGNYVNNIPVLAAKITVGNGVLYETAAFVAPPSKMLWERIASDPGLTYLKAAVERADSGTVAGDPLSSLVAAFSSIGANLTVFAPTDDAFKATLFELAKPSVYNYVYAQALGQGLPPATAYAEANTPAQTTALISSPSVFSNPLLFSSLPAENVRGVIAYHILGSRAFLNNLPTAPTFFKTMLNSSAQAKDHPGIQLSATFSGPMVAAASVKGLANPSAATIAINPTPEPGGSSDQHYVNGTLHKINQVLLPQPF